MDPRVFDRVYVINIGRLELQTDLNLNGHSVQRLFEDRNSRKKMPSDLDLAWKKYGMRLMKFITMKMVM